MKDGNDVVIIQLDRARELRYGHKALKTLSAMTGKSLDELETGSIDFEQIETFLYCGLLADARANGETLDIKQMEDLLDESPSFMHTIEKMKEAFEKAFGTSESPNEQAPTVTEVQPNRSARRGAGKKA